MKVVRYDNASAFQERASPLLLAREAENSLMLSIVGRLAREGPGAYGEGTPACWTVEESLGPVAAALMTPPHRLNLTRAEPHAVAALADELRGSGVELPGVTGPTQAAGAFAERWRGSSGGDVKPGLAIAKDREIDTQPLWGLKTLVSHEAGQGYLRLVGTSDDPQDKARVEEVRKAIATMENLLPGPVTPIIFSLEPHEGLADLLAPGRTSGFDLDGTGRGARWPWVRPDTGILVWDPQRTGRVTSGRQLFGSVTFWLMFRDGYEALDALDDNRDGELAGEELRGLAVWFDRNGDGASDHGEVVPAVDLGVEALATRATGVARDAQGSPMNSAGLRLRGGGVVPTYDSVARPAGP